MDLQTHIETKMNNMANKYEHEIPEGYEARIEGNKVVIEKVNEDERIRKHIIEIVETYWGKTNDPGKAKDIAWLEKQKEHQNNSDAPNESSWSGIISSSDKDKNLDDIAQEYVNGVKEYNQEPTWNLMQTAVCYGYHLAEQKEQIPYTDFVIKPHKGDDNNPYDMQVSEAQEYAIKRGFGIPFNDGEVYVDERHLTQTIGNILRWADEHPKEQKPAMIQWTGHNLKDVIDFTGKSPRFDELFKSWEEYEDYVHSHGDVIYLFTEGGLHIDVPVGAWIVKTPDGFNVPSKFSIDLTPAGWSKEDLENLDNILWLCENCENGIEYTWIPSQATEIKNLINRIKSTAPIKQEWSEDDEKMLSQLIMNQEILIDTASNDKLRDKYWNEIHWLKSFRPQHRDYAITFWTYLDEHRPEGKMCLSNGECADIEKAFIEHDWGKIIRYANKYSEKKDLETEIKKYTERLYNETFGNGQGTLDEFDWDDIASVIEDTARYFYNPQPHWIPSAEQMDALKYFVNHHQGLANQLTTKWDDFEELKSLYEDLKHLYINSKKWKR